MAGNSPPTTPPPPPPPPAVSNTPDLNRYWCYQCDKRVSVETLPDHPDVICYECKNGFVESIALSSHARQVITDESQDFGNEFIQVLRLIAQAARDDDAPPPPPPNGFPADDNDYLRLELDGWDNGNYVVTDDEDQEYRDQVRSRWYYDDEDNDENDEQIEIRNENRLRIENRNENGLQIENRNGNGFQIENRNINGLQIENRNENGEQIENGNVNGLQIENRNGNDEQLENQSEEDEDETVTIDRRDVLRLRLREVANRAANRHNRILDWAEMLIGLEDQSEFRLRFTGNDDDDDDDDDDDVYVGNPGDYVDAAGYERLLQTLAETDSGGRRGPPPAAKSAVENLHTVEVKLSGVSDNEICEICAVCKDKVFDSEGKVVKQLECGHMYHGECIVPWLSSRNTCPVCRFELVTDAPEYEEDRKRRLRESGAVTDANEAVDHGCSSSSGAGG